METVESVNSKLAVQQMNWLYHNKDDTADAYFEFIKEGQSERVSAHKNILAAASTVFKEMFYGGFDLKEEGDIKIVGVSSKVFEAFLQAIYQMHENINMENVSDVICLADKYGCDGVMQICAIYLIQEIKLDNVCFLLDLSLTYRLPSLLEHCTKMIIDNWRSVLKSDSITARIHLTTLIHIIDLKVCFIDPHIIFDTCIKWARKKCEQQLIEATPENLRAVLGDCFSLIQFNQMSMGVFLKIERENPFFSLNEYREIVNAINRQPKWLTKPLKSHMNSSSSDEDWSLNDCCDYDDDDDDDDDVYDDDGEIIDHEMIDETKNE